MKGKNPPDRVKSFLIFTFIFHIVSSHSLLIAKDISLCKNPDIFEPHLFYYGEILTCGGGTPPYFIFPEKSKRKRKNPPFKLATYEFCFHRGEKNKTWNDVFHFSKSKDELLIRVPFKVKKCVKGKIPYGTKSSKSFIESLMIEIRDGNGKRVHLKYSPPLRNAICNSFKENTFWGHCLKFEKMTGTQQVNHYKQTGKIGWCTSTPGRFVSLYDPDCGKEVDWVKLIPKEIPSNVTPEKKLNLAKDNQTKIALNFAQWTKDAIKEGKPLDLIRELLISSLKDTGPGIDKIAQESEQVQEALYDLLKSMGDKSLEHKKEERSKTSQIEENEEEKNKFLGLSLGRVLGYEFGYLNIIGDLDDLLIAMGKEKRVRLIDYFLEKAKDEDIAGRFLGNLFSDYYEKKEKGRGKYLSAHLEHLVRLLENHPKKSTLHNLLMDWLKKIPQGDIPNDLQIRITQLLRRYGE